MGHRTNWKELRAHKGAVIKQDLPSFLSNAPAAAASTFPFSDKGQSYLSDMQFRELHTYYECYSCQELAYKLRIRSWHRTQLLLVRSEDNAYHPVNLFSLFQVDSPCLTRTKVYLLRMATSFFTPRTAALASFGTDWRRNMTISKVSVLSFYRCSVVREVMWITYVRLQLTYPLLRYDFCAIAKNQRDSGPEISWTKILNQQGFRIFVRKKRDSYFSARVVHLSKAVIASCCCCCSQWQHQRHKQQEESGSHKTFFVLP